VGHQPLRAGKLLGMGDQELLSQSGPLIRDLETVIDGL
jgi:hypothetical protein